MKKIILILFFSAVSSFSYSQWVLNISAPESLMQDTCVRMAVTDMRSLLQKANGCRITNDTNEADLILDLPDGIDLTATTDSYSWHRINNTLHLNALTSKGIANGLYGLLQEMLGFKFYHPKEMVIPDFTVYSIPKFRSLSAQPGFKNIGFHLHTMHPIELTEDLLDEKREGGLQRIYEYIDWLARNGQNYFEFNLLESIQLETWIDHGSMITGYAHKRGIRCGLDLSLHMLQQKAFQLYETPPYNFGNIKKQMAEKIRLLGQCNFDIWNVELSATEFTAGNQEKKKEILHYLTGELEKYGIQLMSRNHVVKPDQMVNDGNGKEAGDILADGQGLMVHTVMFYSLTDEKAPVYRNKNLQHMYHILQEQKIKRPVWYFPESAYWVTFDSSVPMFLLPYFSARLSDIIVCEKENIDGHLTFSSGWEWGYCYIDWSIARWCWQYQIDDGEVKRTSLQYINELITPRFRKYVEEEEKWQQEYVKDKELIRVMVAQTITDEIPGQFNLEFHPRPVYAYPYIRNKASLQELDSIESWYIKPLGKYYLNGRMVDARIHRNTLNPVEKEIFDGIHITHLRAWHKYLTLNYLVAYRRNTIAKTHTDISGSLTDAESVRMMALQVVQFRESNYRYDHSLLTSQHKDHTCYHFGYLYPVHELHFWEREELQAKNGNYNFWFRSIWNVGRTVGFYD